MVLAEDSNLLKPLVMCFGGLEGEPQCHVSAGKENKRCLISCLQHRFRCGFKSLPRFLCAPQVSPGDRGAAAHASVAAFGSCVAIVATSLS